MVADAFYVGRVLPELRKRTHSCDPTALLYSGITSLHHQRELVNLCNFI